DVGLVDRFRHGYRADAAFDAVLAQQVQRRIRRAVGRVVDVVRRRAGEAVVRVEARDLDHAFEAEVREHDVGGDVVVVDSHVVGVDGCGSSGRAHGEGPSVSTRTGRARPDSYNRAHPRITRTRAAHNMNPDFKPDEIERAAQAAWSAADAYRVREDSSKPKF